MDHQWINHTTIDGTWPYCFAWEPNITALRRSLPASRASQPASFELCFRTHYTPYTNIRIQPTSKHSSPPSVPATHPHLAAATLHQSLFNQLINGACMDQWESWFGIWNDEDVIFCCFCGQLLWIWHLLSVCQARCGSTLLRRRVFRAFVAYLLNQAVNLTHVSFLS